MTDPDSKRGIAHALRIAFRLVTSRDRRMDESIRKMSVQERVQKEFAKLDGERFKAHQEQVTRLIGHMDSFTGERP
jgi:hypothetical protein